MQKIHYVTLLYAIKFHNVQRNVLNINTFDEHYRNESKNLEKSKRWHLYYVRYILWYESFEQCSPYGWKNRSKISRNHHQTFFDVSLCLILFLANTPFNNTKKFYTNFLSIVDLVQEKTEKNRVWYFCSSYVT